MAAQEAAKRPAGQMNIKRKLRTSAQDPVEHLGIYKKKVINNE
jgi:hypothetical protein